MTETTDIAYSTSTINLRRLAMIRSILVGGLLCLIAYAYFGLDASLNYAALLSILLAMAGANVLTLWLSRKADSVNDRLYFSHLLVDVLGLSALLYFTGGGTNPFVSYYLVPLCISAALLPARFTWALAATCLFAYSACSNWWSLQRVINTASVSGSPSINTSSSYWSNGSSCGLR